MDGTDGVSDEENGTYFSCSFMQGSSKEREETRGMHYSRFW